MIKQELLDLFSNKIIKSDKTAVFLTACYNFDVNIDLFLMNKTFFIAEEVNNKSELNLDFNINNMNKTFFIAEEVNNKSELNLDFNINNMNKTFFIAEEV